MVTLPQHMSLTEQQHMRNNLARAQSLLKRNETLRALDALIECLNNYDPKRLPSRTRFAVDTELIECAKDVGIQPLVQNFFRRLLKSADLGVNYTVGKPAAFKETLLLLRKGLQGDLAAHAEREEASKGARKSALLEKGVTCLKTGDAPKGKAALRVLADEFGEEEGVYTQVGMLLLEADHPLDAVDFLEAAIENFPKDSKAYAGASQAYAQMGEWAKAEAVYLKAIKQFGSHPRTLLNLAKIYIQWNKRDKAFDFAAQAYKIDPSLEEAKAIIDKYS